MGRERALKVVLVVVGLVFCALAYPLIMFVKQEPALAMQFSVYVTLGIFLLFASRNPSANRSLIAFTAWSSFVHAMLMAGQAFARLIARGELIGSAVLVVIGVALIALSPSQARLRGHYHTHKPSCGQGCCPDLARGGFSTECNGD